MVSSMRSPGSAIVWRGSRFVWVHGCPFRAVRLAHWNAWHLLLLFPTQPTRIDLLFSRRTCCLCCWRSQQYERKVQKRIPKAQTVGFMRCQITSYYYIWPVSKGGRTRPRGFSSPSPLFSILVRWRYDTRGNGASAEIPEATGDDAWTLEPLCYLHRQPSPMEACRIQELVTSQWRATLSHAPESGRSMIIGLTTKNLSSPNPYFRYTCFVSLYYSRRTIAGDKGIFNHFRRSRMSRYIDCMWCWYGALSVLVQAQEKIAHFSLPWSVDLFKLTIHGLIPASWFANPEQ